MSLPWLDNLGYAEKPAAPVSNPAGQSKITVTAGAPTVTLNNSVEMPRLGLGTQIQSLERDGSPEGWALLNISSHDAVVAALQAGYRHLDQR